MVTDALHFDGAILHLQALQSQGLELRMAMPTADGRIELAALDRLIDRNTRLVEVSLVAMYNGFEHDLKAVCDLAHTRGRATSTPTSSRASARCRSTCAPPGSTSPPRADSSG